MIELIGQLARVGLAEPAESHRFSKILVVNGGLAHRAVIDSAISGSLRSRFSGRRFSRSVVERHPRLGSIRGRGCVASVATAPGRGGFGDRVSNGGLPLDGSRSVVKSIESIACGGLGHPPERRSFSKPRRVSRRSRPPSCDRFRHSRIGLTGLGVRGCVRRCSVRRARLGSIRARARPRVLGDRPWSRPFR